MRPKAALRSHHPPTQDGRHRQHQADSAERERQAGRADHIHDAAGERRHENAADAPHQREGGIAGNQRRAGETLAEFDDRHRVDAVGNRAPDEDARPDQRRLDQQRQ